MVKCGKVHSFETIATAFVIDFWKSSDWSENESYLPICSSLSFFQSSSLTELLNDSNYFTQTTCQGLILDYCIEL